MGGTPPPKMFPTPSGIGESQGSNVVTPAMAASGVMTQPQKTTNTLANAPSLLFNPYTNVRRSLPSNPYADTTVPSGGVNNAPKTGTSVQPPPPPRPLSYPRRGLLGY